MRYILLGLICGLIAITYLSGLGEEGPKVEIPDLPVSGTKNITVKRVVSCGPQGCVVDVAGSGYATTEMLCGFKLNPGRYSIEFEQDIILSARPLGDRRSEFEAARERKKKAYAAQGRNWPKGAEDVRKNGCYWTQGYKQYVCPQ